MAIDISLRIRNLYHGLSKGHKRIANLVLREPSKVKDYSAARLANLAGVSEATVNRFVRNVGYSGYVEFKEAIVYELQARMKNEDKLVTPTDDQRRSDLLGRTLLMDAENIKNTVNHIDNIVFETVVNKTISTQRKFIIGFGNDALAAKMLFDNFNIMFDNVVLLTSSDDYFAQLISLTKHDQVIIFSVSDRSKAILGVAKFVRSKNANLLLIANHQSSPLVEYSNNMLVARSETLTFSESLSATFSLINALTFEIVKRDRKRITERYKQLQKIRAEFAK